MTTYKYFMKVKCISPNLIFFEHWPTSSISPMSLWFKFKHGSGCFMLGFPSTKCLEQITECTLILATSPPHTKSIHFCRFSESSNSDGNGKRVNGGAQKQMWFKQWCFLQYNLLYSNISFDVFPHPPTSQTNNLSFGIYILSTREYQFQPVEDGFHNIDHRELKTQVKSEKKL